MLSCMRTCVMGLWCAINLIISAMVDQLWCGQCAVGWFIFGLCCGEIGCRFGLVLVFAWFMVFFDLFCKEVIMFFSCCFLCAVILCVIVCVFVVFVMSAVQG